MHCEGNKDRTFKWGELVADVNYVSKFWSTHESSPSLPVFFIAAISSIALASFTPSSRFVFAFFLSRGVTTR